MICGTFGRHQLHRFYVSHIIDLEPGATSYYAMNL
jgi:malate dehydrogenase (oxaloacetate-decarboxylating)(NADP+)